MLTETEPNLIKMEIVEDTAAKRLKNSEYLTYLATNPKITDEIYKSVVDGSFGILTERPCSTKLQDFGDDNVPDIYSSLISYIVDVISNKENTESIRNHLELLSFPSHKINYFTSALEEKREEIEHIFTIHHPSRSSITDCTWRFDQNITTFVPPKKARPKYFILVKTNGGDSSYLRFSCNMNQMHNLHSKVKEIVNHIEKLSMS